MDEKSSSSFPIMSLTEMIRLRESLVEEISRRFERRLAVAFSDIVGSTSYFERFGDGAGRALQQRHTDLLNELIQPTGGRIVDTAGDGAFLCFPTTDAAIDALSALQLRLAESNTARAPEHHLVVRVGIHFGPVLADDTVVTGDSVNLCSRVTATARVSTIRLTRSAYGETTSARRLSCTFLGGTPLKGISAPVDLFEYDWRQPVETLGYVLVKETGAVLPLPAKDVVTFGRLSEHEGKAANDIVLTVPDDEARQRISRFALELSRFPEGYRVRTLSDQITEVDGMAVPRGGQAVVKPGTTVRIGNAITLVFQAAARRGTSAPTVMK